MSVMVGLEYVGYIDPWTDEERLSDEEIVRCRDCCCFHRLHEDGTGVCVRHGHGAAPNGYCAWGEQRDA